MWRPPKYNAKAAKNRPDWYKFKNAPDPGIGPGLDSPVQHHETDLPNTPAMQQLAAVYDWIAALTKYHIDQMNKQLEAGDQNKYEDACDAYNEFLDGLNNQQKVAASYHRRGKPASEKNESPAGQDFSGPAMSWVTVHPETYQPDSTKPEVYIVGFTLIVKWLGGTHSSSSVYP